MTPRQPQLHVLAAVVFVVAWLTPVHEYGTTLGQGGIPGWEAFRVALSPVWPLSEFESDKWYGAVLSVTSALTNFVFVAFLALLLARPRSCGRAAFWTLVAATAINTTWFILGDDRGALRLGYYLWVASFALLAIAVWPGVRFRGGDGEALEGMNSGDEKRWRGDEKAMLLKAAG